MTCDFWAENEKKNNGERKGNGFNRFALRASLKPSAEREAASRLGRGADSPDLSQRQKQRQSKRRHAVLTAHRDSVFGHARSRQVTTLRFHYFVADLQNGFTGRNFPSNVIMAREPTSGSSTFLMSILKLIALMMPSPKNALSEDARFRSGSRLWRRGFAPAPPGFSALMPLPIGASTRK